MVSICAVTHNTDTHSSWHSLLMTKHYVCFMVLTHIYIHTYTPTQVHTVHGHCLKKNTHTIVQRIILRNRKHTDTLKVIKI